MSVLYGNGGLKRGSFFKSECVNCTLWHQSLNVVGCSCFYMSLVCTLCEDWTVNCCDTNCFLGLPAKKRVRKAKRFTCKHCGEKFKYRYQLTRHENRNHKQGSGDAAALGTVPATSGGEIDCSFIQFKSLKS